MRVDLSTGLLDVARQAPSPNHDDRPAGSVIDLIVIHGISLPPGEFGGSWIEALFANTLDPNAHPYFRTLAGLRVSAHLLIRRDGEIVQYVPFQHRAWHAGESAYRNRHRCNDFSIGIELEGTDDEAYTGAQYRVLAAVTRTIQACYTDIDDSRIVGHSDIAPDRKTDPGPAFDWNRYRSLLAVAGEQG